MHTIYLVRKDSKPVYVGYTSKSVKERWKEHLKNFKKPKYPLHHAIKKYGVDSFTIETLYESEDGEHTLNYMEHHYIWLYRTHCSLGEYNVTMGGDGSSKGLTEKERKERRKVYWKAYREANKDKNKDYHKKYYEVNKVKRKAVNKIWYERNRDKRKDYHKDYYQVNKDKMKTSSKAWYEANKAKAESA